MSILKYSTEITLYDSYFDLNDNLSAKSILSIFQDIASVHAEEIGLGFKATFEKHLYWVLSRVKFDILKMPKINQTVIVETWPHEKGKIDFDRDMRILSKDGEVLVIGTSKWCVIDVTSRMLQRTDNIAYNGEICPDVNYCDRFGKIALPSEDLQQKFSYTVRFSDLDHNKHMNNTNYAALVSSVVENKTFTHFEINYLHECKQDDEIIISATITADGEFVIGTVADKTVFTAQAK